MSGNGTKKRTLIEEGTEFKGSLSSNCDLVVMGKVEGDIKGPSVEIAKTGVVAGNVKVESLRSEGEVAGSIEADTVHLSGRVRDHTVIRAHSLEVQLVSPTAPMEVVFGVCELAIGDEPRKADAIAEALAPARPPAPPAEPAPSPAQPEPAPPQAEAGASDASWEGGEPPTADDKPEKRGKGERANRRTQPPPPA
jgi:cytoskeletal protein CcmA (bactofilin family)